jgi:hypothetical protein
MICASSCPKLDKTTFGTDGPIQYRHSTDAAWSGTRADGKRKWQEAWKDINKARAWDAHFIKLPASKLVELVHGQTINDRAGDGFDRGLHHLHAILRCRQ